MSPTDRPSSLCRKVCRPGSTSPDRVPITSPCRGVRPIDVSIAGHRVRLTPSSRCRGAARSGSAHPRSRPTRSAAARGDEPVRRAVEAVPADPVGRARSAGIAYVAAAGGRWRRRPCRTPPRAGRRTRPAPPRSRPPRPGCAAEPAGSGPEISATTVDDDRIGEVRTAVHHPVADRAQPGRVKSAPAAAGGGHLAIAAGGRPRPRPPRRSAPRSPWPAPRRSRAPPAGTSARTTRR